MSKKRNADARRANRKFKELLRDKPFGVGAGLSWNDPNIYYDDWDGEIQADNDDDDDDDDDDEWLLEDEDPQPLDFN